MLSVGLIGCLQLLPNQISTNINGILTASLPSSLQLISLGRFEVAKLSPPEIATANIMAWSPDGATIAVCGSSLLIYGLEQAKVIFQAKNVISSYIGESCLKAKWSLDGTKLFVLKQYDNNNQITPFFIVYDTLTWKPISIQNNLFTRVLLPYASDMSPDGTKIIFRYLQNQLIDLTTNTVSNLNFQNPVYAAHFSPNSNKIAITTTRQNSNTPNAILLYDLSTQQTEPVYEVALESESITSLEWLDNTNFSFLFRYQNNYIDRYRILDTTQKVITAEIPLSTFSAGKPAPCIKINPNKNRLVYLGTRETNFGGQIPTAFLLEKITDHWESYSSFNQYSLKTSAATQFERSYDAFPTPDELIYVRTPSCFDWHNTQQIAFAVPAFIKADEPATRVALNVFDFNFEIPENTATGSQIELPEKLSIFEGRFTHYANTYASQWSPNGDLFVIGGRDGQLKLFDAPNLRLIQNWGFGNSSVYSLDWNTNSQFFASGNQAGDIEIWNVTTRRSEGLLQGHTSTVRSLAWHPTQSLLVSGSWDRSIRLWDTDNKILIKTLTSHTADVHAVAWNTTGSHFASASSDTTVKIWNSDGTEQRTLAAAAPLLTVAWSPDGTKVAAAGWDKIIYIWEASTGNLLHQLSGALGAIRSLDWLSDQALIAGGTDKTLRIYSLEQQNNQFGKNTHIHFERSLRANSNYDVSINGIELQDDDRDGYDHDIFTIGLDPTRKKMIIGVKNGKLRVFGVK